MPNKTTKVKQAKKAKAADYYDKKEEKDKRNRVPAADAYAVDGEQVNQRPKTTANSFQRLLDKEAAEGKRATSDLKKASAKSKKDKKKLMSTSNASAADKEEVREG
ncbi:hypothetical protein CLAFUW4_07144 [Fulvia fulva]|uniref:Uncharacterized protein n=1 Tax=Passalora fulva TaxID=5499 RepID=A0A9Q8PA30_PASFU|nr:uncharacterized protein CLAFUR5_07278 [Fulvia fulva]KAK4621461.1 hypothetical protein CLAFUR4_07153 [Fulvia fulva]KAK4622813.1 hypothetical protein CLAFUR0_07151 [Fulvia fulva]UJO18658.1 hypothetical protein CLAFUR5_07278 [Fulvia fulva]WPV16191.1 hypothetical protein CLAFUW4_07144 [Fulvia fulva]WPV30996.1 hypothetical protein CLAFUW7_07145 [Fulvia fulva]